MSGRIRQDTEAFYVCVRRRDPETGVEETLEERLGSFSADRAMNGLVAAIKKYGNGFKVVLEPVEYADHGLGDTRHCEGCRDDFYNGKNQIGVKVCWNLDTANLVTRFRLSVTCPFNQRSGYKEMRVPNCYRQEGFVFVDEIPGHAT